MLVSHIKMSKWKQKKNLHLVCIINILDCNVSSDIQKEGEELLEMEVRLREILERMAFPPKEVQELDEVIQIVE